MARFVSKADSVNIRLQQEKDTSDMIHLFSAHRYRSTLIHYITMIVNSTKMKEQAEKILGLKIWLPFPKSPTLFQNEP